MLPSEITSVVEVEKCVKKAQSLYLSNARLLANALQITESNCIGLVKVALLDSPEAEDQSRMTTRKLKVKERLYSRFGKQCEFILRSIKDISTTCSGNVLTVRSKQLRTTIYKRRKQLN